MKHIYSFIIILILLTSTLTAQVTLVAPSKMAKSGDSLVVELRAKSKEAFVTMQFTLAWDPSVLSFGRVDTLGGFPPSAISDEYGLSSISQGKLSFVWISNDNNNGFRVQDSSSVFKVVFKAIGANGTSSPVKFVASPTSISANNTLLSKILVTVQDGIVTIGSTGIQEKQTTTELLSPQIMQNYPNPFHSQTIIPFVLNEPDMVVLSVYDFKGQKMLERKGFYGAGTHEWTLNTEGTLANGTYVFSIATPQGISSKVFIKN